MQILSSRRLDTTIITIHGYTRIMVGVLHLVDLDLTDGEMDGVDLSALFMLVLL